MKNDKNELHSLYDLKKVVYNTESNKEPDGLTGDRYSVVKDDTHVLFANLSFVRNQLLQEILESYGIPLEEHDQYGNKSKVDEAVDRDPNNSIRYTDEAYIEEEQAYAQNKLGTVLNNSQINSNRSIGDLVVAKCKNGILGNPNSDFDSFTDIGGSIGQCPDKVGNWNIKDSLSWLVRNSYAASQHICAKHVRMAIEAGGISTAGRPGWAIQYTKYLPTIGFEYIAMIKGDAAYTNYMNKVAPGDIAVMANPKGGPGHICMYSGSQWISDFRQRRAWVYGGSSGLLYIFRFKGMKDGIASGEFNEQLANTGTAIAGWGIASVNCLSMMVACEGWSDASKKGFLGTPFTDATAGNQSAIDKATVFTVGPGLTNAVDKNIQPGTRFSAQQIMSLWSKVILQASKDALRICPALKTLPQGCKDAAIDCMHSGIGWFMKAGWATVKTPQEAAAACQRMPKTAKGKPVKGLIDRRTAEACICLGQKATGSAKRYTDAYYTPNPKLKALVGGKAGATAAVKAKK